LRNMELFHESSMDSLFEEVISSKEQQNGNVVARACLPPRRSVPSLVESSHSILHMQQFLAPEIENLVSAVLTVLLVCCAEGLTV
jgi:hypothetical protein